MVKKGRKSYVDVIVTLDIETTTLRHRENGEWKADAAFPYSIQIAIDGIPALFREISDYMAFRDRMLYELGASAVHRILVFVHNLPFEFQFLKNYVPFDFDSMLAYAPHKPFLLLTEDGEEWRCSYKLSNMSLDGWCRKLGVEHGKAEKIDYDLIRTPGTELSEDEIYYNIMDVISLYECIMKHMENEHENLATLKLTSTSYPRSELIKACNAWTNGTTQKAYYHYKVFQRQKLNAKTYKMMRSAFRGGDTHCNQAFKGILLENVGSFDITSSYPYQLTCKKFPMSKFVHEGPISLYFYRELRNKGRCVIGTVIFTDLRLRDYTEPVPYISASHCRCENEVLYSGRVLKAAICVMCLTDIDFDIIERQYSAESVVFHDAFSAKYDYLPEPIFEVIMKNFSFKCTLKEDSKTDPFKNVLYMKSKNVLNGIYGVMATDIVRNSVMYSNEKGWWKDPITDEYIRETLEAYYQSFNHALHYQHGVWTTAHARASLHELISIVGKYEMVYNDTDSVKYMIVGDRVEKEVQNLNNRITKQAEERGAYVDWKGKRYVLGVWENDGIYEKFISLGAKRYAYVQDGKLHVTVSGVPTAHSAELLGKIENFKTGFTWKGGDTGKLASKYFDEEYSQEVTDYQGNAYHVEHMGGIGLIPSDYTLSDIPYANDTEIHFFMEEMKKIIFNRI